MQCAELQLAAPYGRVASHVVSSRSSPRLLVRSASDKKGFSTGAAKGAAKTSKRGKSASRAGQLSRKDMQQRADQMKQLEDTQRGGQDDEPSTGSSGGAGQSSDAAVPQVVTDRMLKRILIFAGLPVFSGLLLLPGYVYLKRVVGIDLPNWVAFITQSVTFGAGLLGISYGILSTSWQPGREGSLMGTDEFKANLPIVLERFRRR